MIAEKSDVAWREEIAQIGAPIPMHGILTVPAAVTSPMALVILNSGLLHHVGSCGFSVRLARAVAATGVPAIRYDASGIGDSLPRPSALSQDRRAVAELHEVLDFFESRYGISRFALMGLCSGAFTSFEAARVDSRIEAVVQIAPFSYRTSEWYARHYGARVLSSDRWRRYIARKICIDAPRIRGLDGKYLESYDAGWSVPDQADLEDGYRVLIGRDVHLFNIMTGGEADTYLYEGQFRDMFPSLDFGERFTEWYIPDASHTITRPDHQRLVLSRIVDWLDGVRQSG